MERAEKFDRACAFYAWILAAATSKTSERTDLSDSTLATLRNPPVQLVASNAAVKLGLLIDPAKLDESREHFLEGLRWWPSNGMAHLNLGDLERENGSLSRTTLTRVPCRTGHATEHGHRAVAVHAVFIGIAYM